MKVGGEMNINKYIELLRFYLIEKISEINTALKKDLSEEIDNIISSILSAIFAVYISAESIKSNDFWSIVLKVLVPIVLWLIFKFVIWKYIRRLFISRKEIKKSDDKDLTYEEIKSLVEKFDHIACDGVLLSWDFLKKYSLGRVNRKSEKNFYLIEAFYYYKKSLSIVSIIVYYSQCCINCEKVVNGISKYRLENIYESLSEINFEIDKELKANSFSDEFLHEFKNTNVDLIEVKKYLGK